MNNNEVEAAFTLIGLPVTASELEVKDAYRQLTSEHHPDKEGGTDEKQAQINNAYEIALKVSTSGTGLILREAKQSLEAINNSISIQSAQNAVKQFTEKQKREKGRKFKHYRNYSLGFSLIFGLVALLGTNILPLLEDIDKNLYSEIKPIFGFMTVILGFVTLFFQTSMTNAQQKIEDHVEKLSNKKQCASELAQLLGYEDFTEFDEHRLIKLEREKAVKDHDVLPIPSSPSLTTREKRNLTILKSLEHGLIFRIPEESITPSSIDRYRVSPAFRPSVFKK